MNKDREREILKILLVQKKVTVTELARQLFAGESSIRRDLASLENQHLVKRIHGGAELEESSLSALKIPFVIRELEQADAKAAMAKYAANYVKDYDVIFLDASSSAYNLVPFLTFKKNITVMTSGIKTLLALGEYGIKAISTGGELIASCQSLIGEAALKSISTINADICFFSCRGLGLDGSLTDISDGEDIVRQNMITHSRRSYLLCASDKIGKKYFHNLCRADDISGIISESPLPEKLSKYGL